MSASLERHFAEARGAEKRGDLAGARAAYEGVLARFPGNQRARQALAMLAAPAPASGIPPAQRLAALLALYKRQAYREAVAEAEALAPLLPAEPLLHNIAGAAWLALEEPARADRAFRAAIARAPLAAAGHANLGVALRQSGKSAEAEAAYARAIALAPAQTPAHADAHFNLGNLRKARGDRAGAEAAWRTATASGHAQAPFNLGNALREAGDHGEAIAAYRAALEARPDHAEAWHNLAATWLAAGDPRQAVAAAREALARAPGHAAARNTLASALEAAGESAEALAAFAQAARAAPDNAEIWCNLATALAAQDHAEQAIAAYSHALALDPSHHAARAQLWHHQTYRGIWSAYRDFEEHGRSPAALAAPLPPFTALGFADDPAYQLARSRVWARSLRRPAEPLAPWPPAEDGRLRIGYFSADFHDHATMYLLAGVLAAHDRHRFAVHAFSFGPARDDAMRRHLRAHVEQFTDIAGRPDAEAIALARAAKLDIAIDLKGFTRDARAGLFAGRLAPLQLNWLGYPGSMGAGFIDYCVADARVIPQAERAHYDEKLILLPHSYQPNDDARPIPEDAGHRADHGLPQSGFVLCCFNQSYKISPAEWGIWMRLLAAEPGAVLWLLASNSEAEANLRREAEARGIPSGRLVFAPALPHHRHLARLRHADLFLDTFRINAHTTMSDALWAGLPALTLAGRQFAARVGASLLTSAGLPELVIESAEAYEATALALMRDPARLAALRERLGVRRREWPLFDTARFTRAFEAGLTAVAERRRAGLAAADIVVGG